MSSLCFVGQLLTNHYLCNQIKNEMDMGCVACVGDRRDAYRVLVRRPKGKRPLERHRHRWKDNIKINLPEIGWGSMNWIGCLLMYVVLNLQTA